ncbi:MAG TPA: hypothetical protein VF782_03520 [Allosphingosinicella sp.]
MDAQTLSQEVDANFDFFQRRLAEFLECEAGKFALLRHRAVIGFYPDPGTADQVGHIKFPDGLYSIQEVTDEPVNLGLYSNASH